MHEATPSPMTAQLLQRKNPPEITGNPRAISTTSHFVVYHPTVLSVIMKPRQDITYSPMILQLHQQAATPSLKVKQLLQQKKNIIHADTSPPPTVISETHQAATYGITNGPSHNT